jgi:hypothetical protein
MKNLDSVLYNVTQVLSIRKHNIWVPIIHVLDKLVFLPLGFHQKIQFQKTFL